IESNASRLALQPSDRDRLVYIKILQPLLLREKALKTAIPACNATHTTHTLNTGAPIKIHAYIFLPIKIKREEWKTQQHFTQKQPQAHTGTEDKKNHLKIIYNLQALETYVIKMTIFLILWSQKLKYHLYFVLHQRRLPITQGRFLTKWSDIVRSLFTFSY
ncbi:hypothetical protein ACJX0J_009026, partial [Zea mays]